MMRISIHQLVVVSHEPDATLYRVKAIQGLSVGVIAALALMSGCSAMRALEPNSIAPEFEHISHASQHFGSDPTHYGVNAVNLTAEWDVGKHFYLTLAEGLVLDHRNTIYGQEECGALMGGREVFTGRVGYKFILKP